MFVIQIADVTEILSFFSCFEYIVEIELLAYYQQENNVCIIISAQNNTNKKYVLKLLSNIKIDDEIEESRNAFSEFLRKNKLPVPRKYMINGKYCLHKKLNGIEFLITVEDYYGKDIKTITKKSSYELGRILGSMHKVSYESNYHLPMGNISFALKSGKTTFENVWQGNNLTILSDAESSRLNLTHSNAIEYIKNNWTDLPRSAVHGDLALTSNLMFSDNGYGIIDFNLSGDEPLLGDLLVSWYSSRYSDSFIRNVPFDKTQFIKKEFFDGYLSVREFTEKEILCFEKLSSYLNGIYYNRFVVELIKQGRINIAKTLVPDLLESYYKSDTEININECLGL